MRKTHKKLLLVLFGTLLLTGCVKTPKLEGAEDTLATLDGKTFKAVDLYNELKESYGTAALVDMVDKYIVSKEITDEASYVARAETYISQMKKYYEQANYKWEDVLSSNGFTEKSLKEYYVFNYEKEALAEKYYKDNLTEKEIKNYYEKEIIGDIEAKQILITPKVSENASDDEKNEANSNAYNKAIEVITKLNNGEAFDELAKEYSDDESSKVGGTLAPFNKQSNYSSEFINEAISLNVGSYSKKPVKTTYGYHILYIVSKKDKPNFDEVEEKIKESLVKEKTSSNENYLNIAWKGIREKYNLTIEDTIVKEKYDSVMAQYKKVD